MHTRTIICLLVYALLLGLSPAFSATYYTAIDGHDDNPGTSALPWRTIQKAAASLLAGDTVIVGAGTYDERVSTVRAGTGPSNRITFQAQGTVIMKGWVIDHAYVTIKGFEITGWSSSNRNNAHTDVNNDGDYFEMLNCTMRDAIQITRQDMMFHAGSNVISSATGGFVGAGFAPGQTVYVGAATNGQFIANSGTYTITDVTDRTIAVSSALSDDGPLFVYLSSGYVFGLVLNSGTQNCVIQANTFSNLGYDTWLILGNNHLLESNSLIGANGWDVMHFGGANHLFRGNVMRDSPLVVYQVSPDAMENWTPIPYADVTFSNNFISGFAGVLAAQKGLSANSSGLHLTHNVFVDVGGFTIRHPGTTMEHNTFLRVARVSNPVVALASHPILIDALLATNVVIRNNIFVDCGEPRRRETESDVGWYELTGPTNKMVAEGNFAAGSPPGYGAKAKWPEAAPVMNGGDPDFANMNTPLGADGIPFTADDGLRLLRTSKLRGAGAGGRTPGAYEEGLMAPARPLSPTDVHIITE